LAEENKKHDEKVDLTWRDYVGLFIASVETIMVPAIVLIVILLALLVISAKLR
jgi:hypothetical protein